MANLSVFICSLYFLAFTSYSLAMTDEQKAVIKSHFEEFVKECLKENTITDDEMTALRSQKVPTGTNVPCFLACVNRKSGIMDEKGMLQNENILDLAKKVFNDPEELKLIQEYLHSCSHINNEAVSDGENGCERAVLSYKCMLNNAAQFGFEL